MTRERDRLLELAARVAGGDDVAWPHSDVGDPELAEPIANLRRIDVLARHFARLMGTEPSDPAETDRRDRWGHLQLVERIAAGSFGEVWRAFDPVLQREVALKLRREDAGDRASGRSFIEEARRLARVRHPNVLGVHGADLHDGRVGLWCELLEGRTLEEALQQGLAGGPARWLEIGRDVARALAAVHAAGLAHGDVKASNVALAPDGRAVLLDFGAGVDLAESDPGSPSYGSPLSAAPERLGGARPTPAADVWSLGVLLYRLAAGGAYPFEAADVDALEDLHRQRGTASVASVLVAAPKALRRLVDHMLDPASERRPTAAAAADRLRWIAHAPLRRRRRQAVAAVILSLALGAAAAGIGYLHARRAARAAETARVDAEQVNRFLREVLEAPRLVRGGRNVRVAEVLDGAATRLATSEGGNSAARGRIGRLLGVAYIAVDHPDRAVPVLRRAVRDLEATYGERHRETLSAKIGLGDALNRSGDPEAAGRVLAEVAELEPAVPPADEVHAWLRINQGVIAQDGGDLRAAEALFQEARRLRLEVGQPDDGARQGADLHLSTVWLRQGRFQEVVELLEPVAEELAQRRGMRHGNTLGAWNNLALALAALNRREEALQRFEKVAEVAADWLGDDDDYTVNALGNVAATTKELGRVAAAADLERSLLARLERVRGADDLATLQVENNLALSLMQLGDTAEAERRMDELARRVPAALGARHPLNWILGVNRAELRLDTGRPREALAIATATRRGMLQRLDPGHLFVLAADSVIGAARCAAGEPEAGLALLTRTATAQRALGGENDQQALLTTIRLGRAQAAAGDPVAARRTLDEAAEVCERTSVPAEHPLAIALREARAELDPPG